MARLLQQNLAFGAPGIDPRWTQSNKVGVGTAYSTASQLWFTLWNGAVTEVYYPTIDQPQIRDLQFLVTDGSHFFHEEKRHLQTKTERLWQHALGYRITNRDPAGRYSIIKEIISDPHTSCLLQRSHLTGDADFIARLKLYALCAPHLLNGGWSNSGYVIEVAGHKLLAANKGDRWMVMGATVPFARLSCGYVGKSDGWQDLFEDYQLDWEFDHATDGNIGLIGQLDLSTTHEFTLGLAFGDSLQRATATLMQSLNTPFEEQKDRFKKQWDRAHRCKDLAATASDGGSLFKSSVSLLLAHEDKVYSGALIASLSIPWGEVQDDSNSGGYHLVWTRDMVNSAMGLMAAGKAETAIRALTYLMSVQHADGGFAQNFWIDGSSYWQGVQLDEVAFPILLAWKLDEMGELPKAFDTYPMVIRAAGFLIRQGPATGQERWEENSGYSPSTLACNIAALICAAAFARGRGDETTAQCIEEYADFLKAHIEAWMVTTEGTLVPGIKRHFVRITPAQPDEPHPNENPNWGKVSISSRPPGTQSEFPTPEVVDPGFLLLVRYGILPADDPLIVDSLKVIDKVLKVETPNGPCWGRYNHDGYGQREDGSAYQGYGQGRAWPLLAGERGHYELAAGHDVTPYLKAMENFATDTGLLTEQVWDQADLPEAHMRLGEPTGAAMPLMWAHAEYLKLLRSAEEGTVYDLVPLVAERYLENGLPHHSLEVWKFNRQIQSLQPDQTLRVQAIASFRLRWSTDSWQTVKDTDSQAIPLLSLYYVDILVGAQAGAIQFTFFWTDSSQWEQRNYTISIEES